MPLDRRVVLSASLGAGLAATVANAGPRQRVGEIEGAAAAAELGLVAGAEHDQTAPLQAAIDAAAKRGAPLVLPPGRFRVGALILPDRARLIGTARTTTLVFIGGSQFLTADGAGDIVIDGLVLDGAYGALAGADALLSLTHCRNMTLRGLDVTRSAANAIALTGCSGSLSDCTVTAALEAGIRSLDAAGLDILHNRVADCGNNGIQVWRTEAGEDASVVANNRVERIRADGGGTGQNGNGINIFRAAGVLVTGNRIADCAYSAIRGNAASNIQMIANSCARLGEVALYAEFGFEGALIANNLIDTAATGISVTNFNDGGRLAVVQGNLVRNLFRREQEPEDKRGDGISVEADTAVIGNVIEAAPNAGLVIGWGRHMREVVASGNVIRKARVGILVSADPGAGACLLANNMISGASDGSIRAMDGSGQPTGPDLAHGDSGDKRLSVVGNVAV
jgi:uncharacterized secreted repeat protein (TIGR03808 family)